MPAGATVGLKKSKMLLPSITLPVLLLGLVDPSPMTPLVGRLGRAGPMLLFVIVLLLLPPEVEVLEKTLPPAVAAVALDDPKIEQFLMVLFDAPLINLIVLVLAVAEAVVFERVSELPLIFSPSMVTFLAPFKLISGLPAVIAPATVRAPLGNITIDV